MYVQCGLVQFTQAVPKARFAVIGYAKEVHCDIEVDLFRVNENPLSVNALINRTSNAAMWPFLVVGSSVKRLFLSVVIAVCYSVSVHAQEKELVPVTYTQSSVISTDGDLFRLMDGSRWVQTGYGMILPASDITIIITSEEGDGTAFANGVEVEVELISGSPNVSTGLLGHVVQERGDGAILQLSDGSLWEISQYDRYDTGYWLPPYRVIVSPDELYLINVGKGKRVGARPVQ